MEGLQKCLIWQCQTSERNQASASEFLSRLNPHSGGWPLLACSKMVRVRNLKVGAFSIYTSI